MQNGAPEENDLPNNVTSSDWQWLQRLAEAEATIAELREAVKVARSRGIEEERARCVRILKGWALRMLTQHYRTQFQAMVTEEIEQAE